MPEDIESLECFDEDELPDEPDYYMCYCCGYNCSENPGGFGCPKCIALMSPEHY
jgi:rubrerythrin